MKISTKGRYALRMMLYLAAHGTGRSVSLKEIADKESISKKYLEQIVPLLNRAKFLKTARGFQGGYSLANPPEKYTVGDILRAVEGSVAPVACLDTNPNECPRHSECGTIAVWEGLYKVINEYLDGITLADILNSEKESFDYYI